MQIIVNSLNLYLLVSYRFEALLERLASAIDTGNTLINIFTSLF